MIDALQRILRPLRQSIFLMIARGVLRAMVEEQGQAKVSVQLLDGEEAQGVELLQPYGMASAPPADADCLVLCPGGDRGMGICIAVEDRRKRPKGLAGGDVVFYGPGDALAQGEEAPGLPEILPDGWLPEPEEPWDPEDSESDPPPARQRLTFGENREVTLVCDKFTVRAREGLEFVTLGGAKLLWGHTEVLEWGRYTDPDTKEG
jgi:phage gp45-like